MADDVPILVISGCGTFFGESFRFCLGDVAGDDFADFSPGTVRLVLIFVSLRELFVLSVNDVKKYVEAEMILNE